MIWQSPCFEPFCCSHNLTSCSILLGVTGILGCFCCCCYHPRLLIDRGCVWQGLPLSLCWPCLLSWALTADPSPTCPFLLAQSAVPSLTLLTAWCLFTCPVCLVPQLLLLWLLLRVSHLLAPAAWDTFPDASTTLGLGVTLILSLSSKCPFCHHLVPGLLGCHQHHLPFLLSCSQGAEALLAPVIHLQHGGCLGLSAPLSGLTRKGCSSGFQEALWVGWLLYICVLGLVVECEQGAGNVFPTNLHL